MDAGGAASAGKSIVETIRDAPLWIIGALASTLSVIFFVPPLFQLVPPDYSKYLPLALVTAWCLFMWRAGVLLFQVWKDRKPKELNFFITAIDHQCFWGMSKQPDGSITTQVSGHFMVRNRTQEQLHIMKAKLIRPRIRGKALPELVTMKSPEGRMHGTAFVSGNYIPPSATLPVAATLLFSGAPRQKSGDMNATIEFMDADGNKSRVAVKMKCLSQK